MENENKQERVLPTKMALSIRILVAAYVLYLAYGLFEGLGKHEGTERIIFLIAAVIFTLFSCIILIFTGKAYVTGAYVGGKLDNLTKEEAEIKKDILLKAEENQTKSEKSQQNVQKNSENGLTN